MLIPARGEEVNGALEWIGLDEQIWRKLAAHR